MSNPNEKGASIRAKLKFPNVTSFVERYAPNVSTAGIFVKTPSPKPVGTRVKFEFLIADGTAVMRGLGQVAWVRESEADDRPVGMGIKFIKLDAASREVLDRIIDFKHSLGGPPTPSRYSEVPPPYVPEGVDVEEGEAEGAVAPAAAAEEPPRETPPPAPPPKPAIAPPPPPAAPAEEPHAEAAPKKKHRPKPAAMDMSAIDSMLADLAAPPTDTGRKRRKTGEHAVVAPQPIPAPAAPVTEPAPPPAKDLQIPELTRPAAAEPESAELDLESALTGTRSDESEVREELREELEALEGPPPVVLREPPATEAARATGAIRNLITDELESGDLVDMLEPDERKDHLEALGEPAGLAGQADEGAPIRYTPGRLVSFMPPPPSEADSLEEDFESILGGADASVNGEVSSPTAALQEDSGVTELGEDAVIAGVIIDDSSDAQGDFEIVEEVVDGEIAAEGDSGDMVDSMIAEMARDSREPAGSPDMQLLEEEVVSDALDDLFDETGDVGHAASRPAPDAPDTLPDDAVPPGLVRDRPARRPAPPPPPDAAEDAASKKKGFFGKLFGK